ncbi:MAG: M28 family peptidase [Gemmatimonadaceae bacterium]
MSRFSYAFALSLCATAAAAQTKAAATVKPVWPDEGPFKWAPRPTTSAITANDLRTRLYQFADDSMLGRRIGEPGNYKGTAYIAGEFKRLGLKPAGDNGTYFQDMPYGPVSFDSASSRLVAGGATITATKDWMPMAPANGNGINAKADINNVGTVFAGRWKDSSATLDPAVFRGKIAVFVSTAAGAGLNPGRPPTLPRCDSVPDKFGAAAAARVEAAQRAADSASGRGAGGGRGGAGRGGRGGAASADPRLEASGAVGILIISTDSLPRIAANAAWAGRGAMQPATPPATSGIPGAAISSSAAAKLFGKPVAQLTVGTTGQPVTESWSHEWRMSKTPARNVIAIMPGSNPALASEFVLVGAHNDHVGVNATSVDHDSLRAVNTITRKQGANDPACRPTAEQQHQIDSIITRARSIRAPRRDSIMNGADDDGSGTVIMLEIAERFATEKPARSIIFISHEGEEAGLLGSKWFTDHPTIDLSKIVAANNMDMEAKGRTDQVKFGGPSSIQTLGSRRESREFGDIIDSVNATRSEVMAIDKTWDVIANPMNRFCRSDQVNYVHHNVPVTYYSTGYAQDYHQATDEPQYADYDHMARIGRFIHDVMMAIADRKDRLAITGPDVPYPVCR